MDKQNRQPDRQTDIQEDSQTAIFPNQDVSVRICKSHQNSGIRWFRISGWTGNDKVMNDLNAERWTRSFVFFQDKMNNFEEESEIFKNGPTKNTKSVIFSLNNEVGSLAQALTVFKVRVLTPYLSKIFIWLFVSVFERFYKENIFPHLGKRG